MKKHALFFAHKILSAEGISMRWEANNNFIMAKSLLPANNVVFFFSGNADYLYPLHICCRSLIQQFNIFVVYFDSNHVSSPDSCKCWLSDCENQHSVPDSDQTRTDSHTAVWSSAAGTGTCICYFKYRISRVFFTCRFFICVHHFLQFKMFIMSNSTR